MSDTLKDKLSRAAKPGPQIQSGINAVKDYVGKVQATFAPIDKATLNSISDKQSNVDSYKKVNPTPQAKPNSYKKGGKVKRSGMAKVHKGERVLTTKQTKKFDSKGGFSKLYNDTDKDGK
jgi:hypothetical protein